MLLVALLLLQDPDELVRRLADDDPAARQAAAEALVELGEPARAALTRASLASDVEVAQLAAIVLREMDRRSALDALCDGLSPRVEQFYPELRSHVLSNDPDLRRAALLGIHGSRVLDVTPHPRVVMGETLPTPREDMLRIMTAMLAFHPPDNPDWMGTLGQVCDSIDVDPPEEYFRLALFHSSIPLQVDALNRRPPAALMPRIRELAGSENAEVRKRVIRALAAWGGDENAARLAHLAYDPDPSVAIEAFDCLLDLDRSLAPIDAYRRSPDWVLRKAAAAALDIDEMGLRALRTLASDSHERVREAVLHRLSDALNPGRFRDVAAFLDDERLSDLAAATLARIPGETSRARLLAHLRDHPDAGPSLGVVEALRRENPEAVWGWLERCVNSDDASHRIGALNILSRLHDPRATDLIVDHVGGDRPIEERSAALELLSRISGSGPRILKSLDDPGLSEPAAKFMSQWVEPDLLPEVWDAMREGRLPWSMDAGALFPGPELDRLVLEAIRDDGGAVRWALRYADELGVRPDEARVRELASSGEYWERHAALRLLGRYDSEESRAVLREALRDRETIDIALDSIRFPLDAADVAECERLAGDDLDGCAAHEALRPIVERSLNSPDERERARALWALRRNAVPGYAAQAEALLSARHPDDRFTAAMYLAEHGRSESVRPLIDRLDEPKGHVRSTVLQALAALKSREAVEPLARLARMRRRDSRDYIDCLARIDPQAAVATMADVLDPGDEWSLFDALSLYQAHDPPRYRSMLWQLLDRKEHADLAMRRLAELGDVRVADRILAALRDAPPWETSPAAACAVELGLKEAAPLLAARVKRGEHLAIRPLGRIGSAEHIPLIRLHLDPASPTLDAAIEALAELGDPDLERDLDQIMNHSDDNVRIAAARAIQRRGWVRYAPILREWTRDTERDLRLAGVEALVRLRDPEAARCALTVGAVPLDRSRLLRILNRAIPDRKIRVDRRRYDPADLPGLVDGAVVEDDARFPDGPSIEFIWRDQSLHRVLHKLVERTRMGYVIDGDAVRIMPWERAVGELVKRR